MWASGFAVIPVVVEVCSPSIRAQPPWLWLPGLILCALLAASGLSRGIGVVATASTRHRAWLASGAWWGANAASATWAGLASCASVVSALALGLAGAGALKLSHPNPHSPWMMLIPVVIAATFLPALGCVRVARTLSNREVKRTILAGLAPV
jgi:hypothetical protein